MSIGKNIQNYRKKQGLSQKELAEKLKYSTGTIQQYELDKREPKFKIICEIASVLNVTPYMLYDDSESEPDTTEEQFINSCEWLENADIEIISPDKDDGLQQYILSLSENGIEKASYKMDKMSIIQMVQECINEANLTRDDLVIRYLKKALQKH